MIDTTYDPACVAAREELAELVRRRAEHQDGETVARERLAEDNSPANRALLGRYKKLLAQDDEKILNAEARVRVTERQAQDSAQAAREARRRAMEATRDADLTDVRVALADARAVLTTFLEDSSAVNERLRKLRARVHGWPAGVPVFDEHRPFDHARQDVAWLLPLFRVPLGMEPKKETDR